MGTESYYKLDNKFGIDEHIKLSNILKEIKGKFMLSYNDCDLVRDMYKGLNFKELSIKYSLNGKCRDKISKELLIMNF